MQPALLLFSCSGPGAGGPPIDEASITATVSDAVSTVVTVTWDPADAEGVVVKHDGQFVPGENGSAVLYGLPADTDVEFEVVQGDWTSEAHTVRTGSVPEEVPVPVPVTLDNPGSNFVLGSNLETPNEGTSVWILDSQGRIVWYHVPDYGTATVAHRSADGKSIFYLLTTHEDLPHSRIERVSLDGTLLETIEVPYAHHDAIEVPDVGYAVITGDPREVNGENVVGDRILEIAPDGTEREVWNAFDHLDVVENDGWGILAYPEGADWTHANGINYDARDDSYWLSLYRQECVYHIARSDGSVLGTFCGDGSGDWVPDSAFGPQHAPRVTEDGIQFVDNAYDTRESRLVRYTFGDGTATMNWEFKHPDSRLILVLGDIDTLPDGRVVSAWGEWRDIMVVDDQAVDWRVTMDTVGAVAQVEAFDAF